MYIVSYLLETVDSFFRFFSVYSKIEEAKRELDAQLESYSDSDLSDAAYDYDEESEPVSELGELDTQLDHHYDSDLSDTAYDPDEESEPVSELDYDLGDISHHESDSTAVLGDVEANIGEVYNIELKQQYYYKHGYGSALDYSVNSSEASGR